ncbi:glycosyltransferase [Candidatus Daviesbacteria bacterium]|nr:glycosyltransferase [Candidatus Daviesbacteria bacterium]
MSKVDVSIVIPAYNEEKYIENCLKSLVEQRTSLNYEVIVVDNNSTDTTVQIAEKFKDKFNLKVVNEKKQSRGAARYRGFKEAKGEIILSTDADAIVYPEWIDTLVGGLANGEIIATTTSCKTLDLGAINDAIFNSVQPTATYLYKVFFGHYWLAGFSFAIKKDVYIKSGGFSPNLQALEDTDLAQRVKKFGRIKFINKPVIFSGRRFKQGLLSGILAYIKTFIYGYKLKREPVFMGNPR